jgi:hypothetical protein
VPERAVEHASRKGGPPSLSPTRSALSRRASVGARRGRRTTAGPLSLFTAFPPSGPLSQVPP